MLYCLTYENMYHNYRTKVACQCHTQQIVNNLKETKKALAAGDKFFNVNTIDACVSNNTNYGLLLYDLMN